MAEPRRIDEEDEITSPNVAERRPPVRDIDARRSLLHDEPVRSAESDADLLPDSAEAARSAPNDIERSTTAEEMETHSVTDQPAASVRAVRNAAETAAEQPVSLFADHDVSDYRGRWSSIQTAFVDEPRKAVEDADNLVKSVLNKLSDSFTQERQTLADQWGRGSDVSTEDLRITLRRYRSFFDRLLNV